MCVVWTLFCSHMLCPPKKSAWSLLLKAKAGSQAIVGDGSPKPGTHWSKRVLALSIALMGVVAPAAAAGRPEIGAQSNIKNVEAAAAAAAAASRLDMPHGGGPEVLQQAAFAGAGAEEG